MEKELLATAYHEAGHAIACMYFNIPFKEVTIIPGQDNLGSVCGIKSLPDDYQDQIDYGDFFDINRNAFEKDIMISLAGPFAESNYTGVDNNIAASGDFNDIGELAIKLFHDTEIANAYLTYISLIIKNLLKNELVWISLKTLAEELMKKKVLTYEESLSIYKSLQLNYIENIALQG